MNPKALYNKYMNAAQQQNSQQPGQAAQIITTSGNSYTGIGTGIGAVTYPASTTNISPQWQQFISGASTVGYYGNPAVATTYWCPTHGEITEVEYLHSSSFCKACIRDKYEELFGSVRSVDPADPSHKLRKAIWEKRKLAAAGE